MSHPSRERVIVTVDDAHVSNIESLASTFRSLGMTVSNVLSTSGIITGEVPGHAKEEIKKVDGVVNVEPDEEMRAI